MNRDRLNNVIDKLKGLSEETRLEVVTELVFSLESDASWDELARVFKLAHRDRSDRKARQATSELRKGDRVVVSNIKPRGLEGMHAIVEQSPVPGQKRITCRWDDPGVEWLRGRPRRNGSITQLPASCLTKVSTNGKGSK